MYIKYIYLLPNFFTLGNIFCGFFAIIKAVNGQYVHAAYLIFIASFFDLFDGKIARATQSTSRFGIEFDSLADLVSFGVAPALLFYLWTLTRLPRVGWLSAFLFVICGALRLARFNAMVDKTNPEHFTGLPIPCAAWLLASTLIFHQEAFGPTQPHPWPTAILVYATAILMVSNLKYRSFKTFTLHQSNPFKIMVAATLILIAIAAKPQVTLFMLCYAYALLGIIEAILGIRPRHLFSYWQHKVKEEGKIP